MREIKFKVWVPNVMYGPYTLDEYVEAVHVKHDVDWGSDTPLQFTGLKDKNGKDIYEGDVVKGAWNGDVYPVEFTFSWIHQYVEYGREPLEVIGNIYENPELIKS